MTAEEGDAHSFYQLKTKELVNVFDFNNLAHIYKGDDYETN